MVFCSTQSKKLIQARKTKFALIPKLTRVFVYFCREKSNQIELYMGGQI